PNPLPLTLDPHALWHLLTIPLGFIWYKFWNEDAKLERAFSEVVKNKEWEGDNGAQQVVNGDDGEDTDHVKQE
ncbi:hypothetical protein EON65_27000, partial [archaeon]